MVILICNNISQFPLPGIVCKVHWNWGNWSRWTLLK